MQRSGRIALSQDLLDALEDAAAGSPVLYSKSRVRSMVLLGPNLEPLSPEVCSPIDLKGVFCAPTVRRGSWVTYNLVPIFGPPPGVHGAPDVGGYQIRDGDGVVLCTCGTICVDQVGPGDSLVVLPHDLVLATPYDYREPDAEWFMWLLFGVPYTKEKKKTFGSWVRDFFS